MYYYVMLTIGVGVLFFVFGVFISSIFWKKRCKGYIDLWENERNGNIVMTNRLIKLESDISEARKVR